MPLGRADISEGSGVIETSSSSLVLGMAEARSMCNKSPIVESLLRDARRTVELTSGDWGRTVVATVGFAIGSVVVVSCMFSVESRTPGVSVSSLAQPYGGSGSGCGM